MRLKGNQFALRIPRRTSLLVIAGAALGAVLTTLLLPRISQSPAYHNFADQRFLLGIPHCLNVLSNLPFLVVGATGLRFLLRHQPRHFVDTQERWPYAVFFLGVALTSLGSAYYHLEPGNGPLVWDRLPMALAFMSFLAAMIVERISVAAGLRLLWLLLALGVSSVLHWHVSELEGRGDLRFYGLVQFYPFLGILLMVLLFPARYSRTADLLGVGGFYALAKVLEVLDAQIFALGEIVSGHTLKHLAAAVAAYWVLRMLQLRLPLSEGILGEDGTGTL